MSIACWSLWLDKVLMMMKSDKCPSGNILKLMIIDPLMPVVSNFFYRNFDIIFKLFPAGLRMGN